MPNIDAPRGFQPVMSVGGSAAWNGATNAYRIASGYATNIFTNDPVILLTTGYINIAAAASQIRGVATGFYWVGANGIPNYSPYWPAGTVTQGAKDATVYVVDDPNTVFMAKFTGAATNPTVAAIGATFASTIGTGIIASGLSTSGANITTLNTTAQPWRFVDFVQRPDNDVAAATSAYAMGLFMPALHDLRVNTGI